MARGPKREPESRRLVLDASEEDLKVFLEDAEEQLEMLDQAIIQLEQESEDPDLIQQIFRAAHTLKGSSATIGHHKMANLTHAMESVLDEVRNSRLSVTTEVVDALLESLDALRVLKEEVEQLEDSGADFSALEGRLTAIREGGRPVGETASTPSTSGPEMVDLTSGQREAIERARAQGSEPLRVRVLLSPDCQMPAVRLFQVTMELSELGDLLHASPSMDAIEREEVGREFTGILITQEDTEQISGALRTILDVAEIEVAALADQPDTDSVRPLAPTASDATATEARAAEPADGGRPALRASTGSKSVRIDVERLDTLLNLVGELVIDRTRLEDLAARLSAAGGVDLGLVEGFAEATQHLARITDDLQDQIMKSRMLPIENVFNRLPRMVRDLAQRSGKKVQFIVSGQDTELDRSVIEEIGDPLIHLLRNAVDHGIESPEERLQAGKPEAGTLRLSAGHEENQIVIIVEDDGRGISAQRVKESALQKGLITPEQAERMTDAEAVNLIFAPGFSTASQVTEVSGRGVGMDIVRTNIERLNGSVDVSTVAGRGTRFTVKMPLTLAIIQALLVKVGGETFAIPIVSVTETLRVQLDDIDHVRGREAIRLRGDILPLVRLNDIFDLPAAEDAGALYVVAVRLGERQVGMVVDSLVGEQEVVIKSLSRALGDVRGVSGATILGDGQVALIVDVPSLLNQVALVR